MPTISSISSIGNLNLWLDATDFSTIITSQLTYITGSSLDILQWNDKSSNGYQFVPVRMNNDRPRISTNGTSSIAVVFDQVSSFQFISKTQIPANSTVDFFAVVTPYSLWGPRQPFFDSADMTVSETDTRINTQIYADGNDFFRQTTTQNGSNNAAAIYKGNLYIGTNAGQTPNYLQKYNRNTRAFEYMGVPMNCNYTHSLAVYDGKLYTAGGSNNQCNANYGGSVGFGTGMLEFWNGSDTSFISTSRMSTFCGPLVVNNRQLYALTWNGWTATYLNNNTTTLATQPRPQMYTLSTPNVSTLAFVTELQTSLYTTTQTGDYNMYLCNAVSYRGDIWIGSGCNNSYRTLTRLSGTSGFYNSNSLLNTINGYMGVYWGSLIFPLTNEYRMFRWNDYVLQNFGRNTYFPINTNTGYCNYDNLARIWQPSGGMCTYKGLLYTQYGGSNNGQTTFPGALSNNGGNWQSNYVQVFVGERGGPYSNSANYQVTTTSTTYPQCNLMIVHDGKLFMQAGFITTPYVYEYGNGTSLDQSFSTLTSAPILLQIRKSQTACQMFMNGTLVESQAINFTYSNQNAREMWIGGAAGTMSSGQSDSGSDHFQGSIHTIAQYNSNLNTADRQKVEGILAWTHSIQNVLPASHPYAFSSP